MSTVLDGLYYSESHEWLKVEGEFGYIGITDYAQINVESEQGVGTRMEIVFPENTSDRK